MAWWGHAADILMVIRLSARFISVLILALLAALALTLVLRATPEGLALSDDSIAYIAGARSMIAGNGYREAWLASNGPVTNFPRAYPSVLAALGWSGLDPIRGARLLGAVLFALSAAMAGVLGWRMTRSLPAGLFLAALFVLNASLLRVHATALSEPLFIFLSLLAFWMFDLYHERDAHWLWLAACATLVGMAYLARYAALALAAMFVVALLILHDSWRRRLVAIGIFLAGLAPWVAGWAARNAAIGGTPTNRILIWHPITAADLDAALRTAASFIVPVEPWRQALFRIPGFYLIVVVAILAAVLVHVFLWLRGRFRAEAAKSGQVISVLSALFIFSYLGSLLTAMSLFDASTKFKLRILAPVYVPLLILLVALCAWVWGRRRELAVALGIVLIGAAAYGQVTTMTELMKGGQGYASFRWYDSQAMAFLRELPSRVMIYTNEPGAVYLYTARPGYVLPDRVDPVTAAARPGFEQGVQQLQSDVQSGKAVLALFAGGDTPAADGDALSSGLHLVHKSGGAEIYGAAP